MIIKIMDDIYDDDSDDNDDGDDDDDDKIEDYEVILSFAVLIFMLYQAQLLIIIQYTTI
jgi:hypothetical protein